MKKKHVYDQDGDFYPITHTQAVITPDGRTLEEKMQSSTNDVEGKLTGEGGANVYPFKHLGTFANVSLANNALDAAFVSSDAALQGHLRLIVNGQIMWCDQYALNYSLGHWLQVVFGVFKPSSDGSQLIYDYSKYHVAYRYRDGSNTPSWKDYSVDGLDLNTIVNLVVEALGGSGGGAPAVVDSSLDPTSTHAIQNKAVYDALYNESTGLATQISAIQTALTAGKIVMADGWGVLPSNPTEGMVAFVGGKIKTYTSGAWSDADPDETALYVAKASNVLYRWNGDVMESMVGQEVEDEWVLNSKKPVQSKVVQERFKSIEERQQGMSKSYQMREPMATVPTGQSQSKSGRVDGEIYTLVKSGDKVLLEVGRRASPISSAMSYSYYENWADMGTIPSLSDMRTSDLLLYYLNEGEMEWYRLEASGNGIVKVQSGASDQLKSTVDSLNVAVNGTQEHPEQGMASILQTLSGEAVKGVKVNGGALIVPEGGVVDIELPDESSDTLKAETKSDWAGETKSDHKLTNFDWVDDTDDAILVVDPNTKELWLGYCSDKDSDPRTYIYYQEWINCGPIPASDTIAEKGQLIQYVLDGTTYLATYNSTTHKVVPTGGGSEAIAQIDNSNKPVQSQVLKQEFDSVRNAIEGIETGVDFSTFDYRTGNKGIFTFDKAPEDITVEDVDSAYKVPETIIIDKGTANERVVKIEDIPIGPASASEIAAWEQQYGSLDTVPHLWTDYELTRSHTYISKVTYNNETEVATNVESTGSISAGDNVEDNIAKVNARLLRAIVQEPSCVGLKISGTYRFFPYRYSKTQDSIKKTEKDDQNNDVDVTYYLWVYPDGNRQTKCYIKEENDNYNVYSATNATKTSVDALLMTFSSIGDYNTFIGNSSNKWYCATYPTRNYPNKSASDYKAVYINIPKDFAILGTIEKTTQNGETVYVQHGKLISNHAFLYTEYSLYMKDVNIHKKNTDGYVAIYINTQYGIDQLQAINCSFTGDGTTDLTKEWGYREDGGDEIPVYLKSEAYENGSLKSGYHERSKTERGDYIHLFSPHTRPFMLEDGENDDNSIHWQINGEKKYVRKTSNINYINHIYVKGNYCQGGGFLSCSDLRIVKSCRVIKNTIDGFTSTAITFSVSNSDETLQWQGTDLSLPYIEYHQKETGVPNTSPNRCMNAMKSFMSCPVYIVGNEFNGQEIILKKRNAKYQGNITAALVETCRVYLLRNTIKNLIAGVSYRYYSSGSATNGSTDSNSSNYVSPESALNIYPSYLSSHEVYACNNVVKNLVRFARLASGGSGIIKSKNTNTGLLRGGVLGWNGMRYFKRNSYSVDTEFVGNLWDTFRSNFANSPHYNANENAYDAYLGMYKVGGVVDANSLVNKRVLSIAFTESTIAGKEVWKSEYSHVVLRNFTFSENILDAGNGNILGFRDSSSHIPANTCDISGNIFKAARYAAANGEIEHYDEENSTNIKRYLFIVKLFRVASIGYSSLRIENNVFTVVGSTDSTACHIHFFCNKALSSAEIGESILGEPDIQGDSCSIQNNQIIGNGSIGIVINKEQGGNYSAFAAPSNHELDELKSNYSALEEWQDSIDPVIWGIDIQGLSRDVIFNPIVGDKYVSTKDGEDYVNVLKNASDLGYYARVSFRVNSTIASNTKVNLQQLRIPFSEYETNALSDAEYAEGFNKISSSYANTLTALAYDNSTKEVTVSSHSDASEAIKLSLLIRGYTLVDSDSLKDQNEEYKKHPGCFALYWSSNTNFIRIVPKIQDEVYQYLINYKKLVDGDNNKGIAPDPTAVEIFSELKKLVFWNDSGSSAFPGRMENSTSGYRSFPGKYPIWTSNRVSGVKDTVDVLDGKTTLNRTIINNLLAALNTMRKAQDENAADWVINDDGTITEEQGS